MLYTDGFPIERRINTFYTILYLMYTMQPTLPKAPHTHCNWLTPNILVGAVPITATFDELKRLCYYFVDLRTPNERGMKYRLQPVERQLSFPMPPGGVGKIKETRLIVDQICHLLATEPDRKMYIHCQAGCGRTSVIASMVVSQLYDWDAPTALKFFLDNYETRAHKSPAPCPETNSQVKQVFRIRGNPDDRPLPDRSDRSWLRKRKRLQ